jgi:undecaprenyl diphosphate synthase
MEKSIPKTVGIILDGNRRWAKERGLPTLEGHRQGAETLRACLKWAKDAGVTTLIVYGFSTENWKRTEEEVSGLMDMIAHFAKEMVPRALETGTRIRFIGLLEKLPEKTRASIAALEKKTQEGEGIELVVALSYGGRAEIVEAMKRVSESEKETLTEEVFGGKLWTAGILDPDLIIRTGGQKRLSNFLLWQCAYSELFFIDTYWPAFTQEMFHDILREYGNRQQNRGK